MNRVSIVLFFKESRPGLANILRVRAQIFYKFQGFFFRVPMGIVKSTMSWSLLQLL